jgi:hypothetical protein
MTDDSQLLIDQCTADQLKALLALARGPLPDGQSPAPWAMRPAECAERLTELCKGDAASGELLLTTVSASETPLAVLDGIKELAKRLLKEAPGDAHRAAATLLYHAAVAAALANHGVNISSRASASRWPLYEDLSSVFADHPLRRVFRQAADRIAAAPEGSP